MKTNLSHLTAVVLTSLAATTALASTVSLGDPQAGGIGYKYTVTMGGLDAATFSNHVGAWSWEDNSLFNAANGEPPVGWTHTSNWIAVNLTATAVFKVRLERDATVPWPSQGDPGRLASTTSMYPSFTIWKNWDNDLAPQAFADANNDGTPTDDWHAYNNRGAVAWAEDLQYNDHYDNSTLETIERTYILPAGQYTLVLGSNAPATDTNRQGYKATFTTTQELPVVLAADSYFTASAIRPLAVPVAKGVLENDSGVGAGDVIQVVTPPAKGSVTLNADGSFTYTPGAYFGVAGYDFFTYRLLLDGDPGTPTPVATASVSTFAAAAGCHVGHIESEDTAEVSGLIRLDVTRNGTWTGSVWLLGKRHGFSGTVGLDGELKGRGRPPLVLHAHLSTHADGDRHAHVHIPVDALEYTAHVEKSPFSLLNPPPSLGRHKVSLTVDTSSVGAPQTAGGGTLTVMRNGSAILAGRLGDRTPFSCATALVEGSGAGPEMPVYAAVYRKPIGSVIGELGFGASATSGATGSLEVIKPAQLRPVAPGFTITYDAATTTAAALAK